MSGLREFLGPRSALIADASPAARAAISVALEKLGADRARIHVAATFETAHAAIERHRPPVVVCDYDLGGGRGLALLRSQREGLAAADGADGGIFILATANSSQVAVARAAEEDVDTYILKPVSGERLRAALADALQARLQPSPYLARIEAGKRHLAEGRVDEAVAEFERARALHRTPALACFYLGQAHQIQSAIAQAEHRYAEGLAHNRIHYKCLAGLAEVLSAQDRHAEAYVVARRLARYYPADPGRLTQALRLALLTHNYEDVERYHQAFTRIAAPDERMVRAMCAALVVCGKHYLRAQHGSRARELFAKAAAAGRRHRAILREVVLSLIEAEEWREANAYLPLLRQSAGGEPDYLAVALALVERRSPDPAAVHERARSLIEGGARDPLIYRTGIRAAARAGDRARAEAWVSQACHDFPEQSAEFIAALGQAPG